MTKPPTATGQADRAQRSRLTAPVAERRGFVVESPHGGREDPYYWLRDDDRRDPQVLAYLAAENAYAEQVLASSRVTADRLYAEFASRIAQDDSQVPYFDRGYWYYRRFKCGQEYPIIARKKGSLDAAEEVLLDENELAQGHEFFNVGNWKVSPDGRKLAYAQDIVGRNQYEIRIKDLATGKLVGESIENAQASLAWANDSRTLYYVERDPTTLLGSKVRRSTLGASGPHPVVYEELDKAFFVDVRRTKSGRYLVIELFSVTESETRLVHADRPASEPRVFYPREQHHLYSVEHVGERYIIRSNWRAENYRVLSASERTKGRRAKWRELVPHRKDTFVSNVAAYRSFLAIGERSGGINKIRVLPGGNGQSFYLDADEPAYAMAVIDLPGPESRTLRYRYTSLTTPESIVELDLDSGKRTIRKQAPVGGDFAPEDYVTEFISAPSKDGTEIPVSLVYRKTTLRDGTAPLLISGYGAYGASYPPRFSSNRLSLLDRGFVFAIAHVRGGQEMGRRWYDQGRLLAKKNTFSDFIAATEHLVAQGYAAPDKVFASGGSAGGLLMGAIANMRPELYRGIVASVPFVDVVTTMLDETIPLTSNEFDEWGDPKKAKYYEYMLSYSPYDNVRAQNYPAMLVTAGLWDSQVQYFEPAKWVAKLRAAKTDGNPLLLVTDMDAGHGGQSGRFRQLKQQARNWAFVLQVLGQAQ